MENESNLKESLTVCEREKKEFVMKCTVLEGEKEEQSQTVWYDCFFFLHTS